MDSELQESIMDIVSKHSNSLELKRFENTKKAKHINVTLNVNNFLDLQKINKQLLALNENLELVFIDNIY